jgi:hypothetical protein
VAHFAAGVEQFVSRNNGTAEAKGNADIEK